MYISCIFHVVCATFSPLATRKLADANPVSSSMGLKHLRRVSLMENVKNTCVKSHYWEANIKRDIHVQNIKVEKLV